MHLINLTEKAILNTECTYFIFNNCLKQSGTVTPYGKLDDNIFEVFGNPILPKTIKENLLWELEPLKNKKVRFNSKTYNLADCLEKVHIGVDLATVGEYNFDGIHIAAPMAWQDLRSTELTDKITDISKRKNVLYNDCDAGTFKVLSELCFKYNMKAKEDYKLYYNEENIFKSPIYNVPCFRIDYFKAVKKLDISASLKSNFDTAIRQSVKNFALKDMDIFYIPATGQYYISSADIFTSDEKEMYNYYQLTNV